MARSQLSLGHQPYTEGASITADLSTECIVFLSLAYSWSCPLLGMEMGPPRNVIDLLSTGHIIAG